MTIERMDARRRDLHVRTTRATRCRQVGSVGARKRGRPTEHGRDPSGSTGLGGALRIGDAAALFVGFAMPLLLIAEIGPRTWYQTIGEGLLVTLIGLWSIRFNGLWTSQVMSVRSIEVSRICRALVILSGVVLVLDRKSSTSIRAANIVVAVALGLVVLVLWRSAYRAYLNAERRRGRFTSRVIVVGTGRQARELRSLFDMHPELGLRLTAVVGSKSDAGVAGLGHLWAGTYLDARNVLADTDAEMVFLCAAELDSSLVNVLTRDEHARGRTLYVDPGLAGLDHRRMHATAIGHQPLLEMSWTELSGLQLLTKRIFDTLAAAVVLLLAAPVLAVVAILIKLEDRGPIIFRQQRVGRDGQLFEMLKFRTMVVDAEALLATLQQTNERNGPLFKMERDPRITRIGRFLRATSLDELPQLLNVLNGTMSLVGPRPALQSEVAAFPAELNARHDVRPGITGLWQVEARDNPSFDAYLRLDLFYVQNWSLSLDMVLLLGTVEQIVFRPLMKVLYRDEDEATQAAVPTRSVIDDVAVA